MKTKLQKFALLSGDIAILYLSLYLALFVRYLELPNGSLFLGHVYPFSATFAAWIIIFYISDLYNIHLAVNNSKFFSLTIRAVIISGLLSALFFYLNPAINITPKRSLLIYLVVFTLLFLLWRRTFNILLYSYLPKEKLLVIGFNQKVGELAEILKQKPHLGYQIAFVFEPGNRIENNGITQIKDIAALPNLIKTEKISSIILASDPARSADLRSQLFPLLHLKINFLNLPNFYENITGKVPIDAISESWFLQNLSEGNKRFFDIAKRAYDIFFALLLLLLTGPFWLLFALAVKLESPGPAFYRSTRLGKNNKVFAVLKFRTMREEGNSRQLTEPGDPRVTRLGAFFRKTRIDELPQAINILKNDMSFVGPRPERPEFVDKLEKEIPFYHERLLVKPGLTGWDQVSGEYHSASREDSLKKLQYDLFYIKNRSLYLDFSILLKTIAIVLKRNGI